MEYSAFRDRLWPDMVALYKRNPDLASACLHMQDTHGADVPLLLTLALADRAGLAPQAADLPRLVAAAAEWRDNVVAPLRAVRRWQKPRVEGPEEAALRERIKAAELEAERMEITRLAALLADLPAPDPAGGSAAAYLRGLGVPGPEADDVLAMTRAG